MQRKKDPEQERGSCASCTSKGCSSSPGRALRAALRERGAAHRDAGRQQRRRAQAAAGRPSGGRQRRAKRARCRSCGQREAHALRRGQSLAACKLSLPGCWLETPLCIAPSHVAPSSCCRGERSGRTGLAASVRDQLACMLSRLAFGAGRGMRLALLMCTKTSAWALGVGSHRHRAG